MRKTICLRLTTVALLAAFGAVCGSAQDLKTCQGIYEKTLAGLVMEQKTQARALSDKYLSTLTLLQERAQKAGDLDGLLTVTEEMGRVTKGEPLVDKDTLESKFAELKTVRAQYEAAVRLEDGKAALKIADLTKKYEKSLAALQVGLTRKGRIDDATAVKAERDGLNTRQEVVWSKDVLTGAATAADSPLKKVSGDTSATLADAGWQALFNGRDLTGWRANCYTESWSVVGGAIRACATTASSYLFYVGDKPEGEFVPFTNFTLEFSARGEPNSNSGIYFHTDYRERGQARHLANGYEMQLCSAEKGKSLTGSLYGVVDLNKSPVDETRWFSVRITVKGKHITLQINDRTTVDYIEPDDAQRSQEQDGRKLNPMGGALAFQGYRLGGTFYFKNIRIRRLP